VLFHVHIESDEAEILHHRDVSLQRLEIRQHVRVVVVVSLGEHPVEAIRRLYTEDVVLMRPFRPSVVGKAAVRQPSAAGARKLNIKFTIAEIVEMTPDWAFARTNSAGTITLNATGATSPEANQELFIFRKDTDGAWKIARYSFSPTIPRPQ